ncbi:hypothetical protein ACFY4C_09925 [Actinomadura viridis]|uniref:hypothetical protein n=1 Tax=Actinomadura viridis TaxID=58110 RepID=UPI00369682ED
MSPDAAERLLDGASGDPWTTPEPLVGLLAAASAPARDGELDGEEAAVAAFHTASSRSARAAREAGRRRSGLTRLLPVRVAVVALATTAAAGGVAVAGHVNGLPLGPLSSKQTPSSSGGPLGGSGTSLSPDGTPPDGRAASPSATPPAMAGLCRAYLAADPSDRARELDRPSLRALVEAAGGASKVPAYCAALAESPRKGKETDGGSPSGTPTHRSTTPTPSRSVTPTPKGRQDQGNGNGDNGVPRRDTDTDDGDSDGDGDRERPPNKGKPADGTFGDDSEVNRSAEPSGTPSGQTEPPGS